MSRRVRVVPAALLAGAGIALIGAFAYFWRGITADELQFYIVIGAISIFSVFALYLHPLYSPKFVNWGHHVLAVIPFLRSPRLTVVGIAVAALFLVLQIRSHSMMDSARIIVSPSQCISISSSFGYISCLIFKDTDRNESGLFEVSSEDTAPLRQAKDRMARKFNYYGGGRKCDPYESFKYQNTSTRLPTGRQIRSLDIRFPHWLVSAVIMVFITLAYARAARKYMRVRRNHCRTCEYDLTGNTSGVCPECGSEVTGSTRG
jgi:hypothetical protein